MTCGEVLAWFTLPQSRGERTFPRGNCHSGVVVISLQTTWVYYGIMRIYLILTIHNHTVYGYIWHWCWITQILQKLRISPCLTCLTQNIINLTTQFLRLDHKLVSLWVERLWGGSGIQERTWVPPNTHQVALKYNRTSLETTLSIPQCKIKAR